MTGHQAGALIILFTLFSMRSASQDADSSAVATWPDSVLLGNVQVTAYRTTGRLLTIPGSISVVNRENLVPTDGTNLASSLNLIPGVTMQTGTYLTSRIVIRGMGSRTPYNSNRIRAYLNEIPLTSSDGVSTPEEIDLMGIEKIELIKGPSSSLYGSGLGGSLNMYTLEADSSGGSAGIQYGSFNTIKASLSGSYRGRQAGLRLNVNHLTSDGYRENNEYDKTTALAVARWSGKGWSASSTLLFIDVSGGIPSSLGKTLYEQAPWQAAATWKAVNAYKDYSKGLMSLSLTGRIKPGLTGNVAVFGRINDSFERRPFNDLDDKSLSGGFRGKLNYRSGKTEVTAGMEMLSEQYEWKLLTNNLLTGENREKRNHFNIFGIMYFKPVSTLNISFASALNYTAYMLTDKYLQNGDQSEKRNFPLIVSPRAGINYSPSGIVSFYASAGHGFSLPSPEETLLPAGDVNHDILPETGWQLEAGSRLDLPEEILKLEGTVYLIGLKNLLVTKRITEDIFTGINAGKTRHLGFELMARALLFRLNSFPGSLNADLSFNATVNRFIDFTDDGQSYDGNLLPGIPGQNLSLWLRWIPFEGSELSVQMQYSGGQYINDSNSISYPGYFTCNLRLGRQLRAIKAIPVILYGGINNITDTHYSSMLIVNAIGFGSSEPRYYYPALPRNYFAGLRISF